MNADNSSKHGIWPPYEAFYVQAMLFNTASAVASIQWVSGCLERVSRDMSGDPLRSLHRTGLLSELQNIVLQAAALSRYFWPVRQDHETRARRLRDRLDIMNDNPLRNRDLRNEIEHFDEKLDAYLADGIVGNILPEYVGVLAEGTGAPVHMFRAYYIDAGIFEMLGKRYAVEPLAEEIQRLHQRLLVYPGE